MKQCYYISLTFCIQLHIELNLTLLTFLEEHLQKRLMTSQLNLKESKFIL